MQPSSLNTLLLIGILMLAQADAQAATTPPNKDNKDKVTVYRCIDAKGKISLQDSPCLKTSKQETREMLRPKDSPPVKKTIVSKPNVVAITEPMPMVQNSPVFFPPPDLYQCTNYEGKTRDSENYDPNPRCEPLWVLGYREEYLPIEQRGNRCQWVQDSCVRYEGRALCDRWKQKQKQAQSDLRYAFSDTSAFRKSDLARITQIVRNSCQ
jgi:hypothetical protein